jgi:hypothetical protein
MIAQNVAEIVSRHVRLTVEGIDRMYLNVFVAGLQYEQGIIRFFREHRGQPLPSAALMSPMTRRFVAQLEDFVSERQIPMVQFCKGQRKDEVMAEHLRRFAHEEGIVFVGKAQENTPVFRTERRRNPKTGQPYPWIVRRSAMVNNYYVYAVDRDFGPFFLKFCSYFPFNAKLCLNGHEYAKRQLAQKGIAFEALDNGILKWRTPSACRRFATGFLRPRSMHSCANGCGSCRIPSLARTARPATATLSRSCRRSSPPPRSSTDRCMVACSSSR